LRHEYPRRDRRNHPRPAEWYVHKIIIPLSHFGRGVRGEGTCLKFSTDRASANKANCAWDAARPSSIKTAKKYCSPNAPITGIGACPAVTWRRAKAPPKPVSAKCWKKRV